MASRKILVQLDIAAASNLTSPSSGFVGFSAKADGLYQKIGTSPELRLLTSADVQNAILADGSITGAVSQAQIFTMGVKLYNLTQGYVPYASDATKLLNNSPIYTDGTSVGIGTASPQKKIDITGGDAIIRNATYGGLASANLFLSGGTSDNNYQDGYAISSAQNSLNGGAYLSFSTVTSQVNGTGFTISSEKMRIDKDGNVGIGTTDPGAKLSVVSGTNGTLNYPSGNWAAQIYNQNYAPTSGGLVVGNRWADNSSTVLDVGSLYGNGFGTAWSSFFTVKGGGNVGIGTPAPNQQLEITQNFRLPSTTGTTPYGIIYKGTAPFIHDFNYGNNGTVTTAGQNTFVGINAGNFTMGSTAIYSYEASYNTVIGFQSFFFNTTGNSNTTSGSYSLYSNTTGSTNIAIGYAPLFSNTTGSSNVATGSYSLYSNTIGNLNTANGYESLFSNTTGSSNVATGSYSLYSNTTGHSNTANGYAPLYSNTTGYNNTAYGHASLNSNTTGNNNTALGFDSGRFIANGTNGRSTGDNGLYLGYNSKASADGTDNEIVIGYNAIGKGSNTAAYGNSSMAKHIFEAGNVGIGTMYPTASLHIKEGTATAGTAPIKLTSGTNLTTPEGGAIEFSSSRLYFTPSTTRETVAFISDITSASHAAVTIGAIGSVPNANGMSISGQTLSLQPASANYGGILTNSTQTIAGNKTFSGNISGSGSNLLTDIIIDTHPESSLATIPFINNDIAYNDLRGGSTTVNIGSPSNGWYDGSPSYDPVPSVASINAVPEGYIIETTFHKLFYYGYKIGVSFGSGGWSARHIKVETYRTDTSSWETIGETTTNGSAIYQVSNGTSGYAISKMRFTFSDFPYNGFRIAQLWLLNYNSEGPKEVFVARNGSTMFGTLDLNNNILTNIGNVGTNFIASTGGLNLAGLLTSNGGISNPSSYTQSGTSLNTFTGNIRNTSLTASKVVFTDGSKNLTSTGIGTASQFIKGDGSLDSNTYITSGSISGFVPYTGATQDVNIGTFGIAAGYAFIGGLQLFNNYIQENEVGIHYNDVYTLAAFDTLNLIYSYGSNKLRISDSGDVSIDKSLTIGNTNTSSYTDGGYLSVQTPSASYASFDFYSKDTFDDFGIVQIIANPDDGIKLRAISIDYSSDSYLEIRHLELGFYTNLQKRLEIAQSGSINAFGNTITSTGGFIGNASTATKLQTARTITIGNQSLSFDGTANLTYSLANIGVPTGSGVDGRITFWSGTNSLSSSANLTWDNTSSRLSVNSISLASSFKLGTSTTAGYVLTTDAYGNGTWQAPTGSLSGFVPYTGANDNVNLGTHNLSCNEITTTSRLTIGNTNTPSYTDGGYLSVTGSSTNYANLSFYSKDTFDRFGVVNIIANPEEGILLDARTNDNSSNSTLEIRNYDFSFYTNSLKRLNIAQNGSINAFGNTITSTGGFIGNASTATKLETARTITIGNQSLSFDGTANLTYSLSGIGIPVGTASQYIRGDLSLATFPTIISGSGATGYITLWDGTKSQTYDTNLIFDSVNNKLFTHSIQLASSFKLGTSTTAGYVLTTDAYGNGTWQAPTGGGSYTLPTATASVLGVVKIGSGITISSGVISVSTNYEAPLTFSSGLTRSGNAISVTSGTYVPFVGADRDVNLASYSIYAYDFLVYSDINLKCNIEDIKMKKLDINYKQFEYKTSRGEKRYGVIAQELLSIAPEFVSESNNSYAVKYTDLLIYEVAQLKEEVKQLKSLLCR